MIAPPRVASPGRSRTRSRHKEQQQQRPRAQTDWMSFGAALEASARSASPADREPIPQHFTPAPTQQNQQEDMLGIFGTTPQPSSVPTATMQPIPQNLPFSAPTAAQPDPFRQTSWGGGDVWDAPTADDAPPAMPRATEDEEPKKKKKKKKKEGRGRSKTVGSKVASPRGPPSHPAPPPPATDDLDAAAAEAPPPKKKLKQIDVLPLLHTGLSLTKFKMTGGGKGKMKKFNITPDNKFLCWDGTKFAKSAQDRQIFLGSIREIRPLGSTGATGARLKNPQWALSIVYQQNGEQKAVNVCAQTEFHFEMVMQALEKFRKMWRALEEDDASDQRKTGTQPVTKKPTGEDEDNPVGLNNLFELYCEFPKEVLPEHLRRQKFKWEAVPQGEMDKREEESRERAMTTPIGHDGSGMGVNVEYPGSGDVPTANSEQIMQRDRAFSAGLVGR